MRKSERKLTKTVPRIFFFFFFFEYFRQISLLLHTYIIKYQLFSKNEYKRGEEN